MLSADLLLKGLGGLAVVGGATTVGVCYKQEKWIFAKKKVETLTLEKLAEKVGLVCKETKTEPTATAGVACNKGTGNIKVKKDSKFELADLPNANSGKIKVYKTSEGEKYNNDFKFVIEEGDIGTENNKKLEEFETYEIKNEDNDWRLTKKTSVNDGIKKALGLPEGADCDLPTTTTDEKTCSLDDAKFKKVNFDGKGDTGETVSGNINLKISKVEDSNNDYGDKYKFKFALETTADTKISKTVTIKKGTNTEFKIKANPASGAPKTLTLEKAWTVKSLGEKAGLSCPENGDTASSKECTLQTSKVNLKLDDKKKFSGLSKKDTAEKKVKYDVGEADYSQGYRFYTDESNGIELQNGTADGGTDSDKKIEPKGSAGSEVYYEILKDTDGKWYLTKKAKAQGS